MWFTILEFTWTANYPWSSISAPSFVSAFSIFAALNPYGESSVPMSRRVWYRLLWQPDYCTPFWQHFLSRQLIHCNVFRMRPPDSLPAPQHENTSLPRFGVYTVPVKFRIIFKLCVLMHLVHIGHAPVWHGNGNRLSGRGRFRSVNTLQYELPLIVGGRPVIFSIP